MNNYTVQLTSLKKQVVTACLMLAVTCACFAAEDAPTQAQANFERQFMTMMINHHHMANMMSALCQDRAVHDELKDLCEEMGAMQTAEIERMQAWLSEWYELEYQPMMTAAEERELERLEALTGEPFEIAFMQTMVRHHQQAIRQASQCQRRAYHEELKVLCEEMAMTQSEEVETMNEWLCDWYDICPRPAPSGSALMRRGFGNRPLSTPLHLLPHSNGRWGQRHFSGEPLGFSNRMAIRHFQREQPAFPVE